MKKKMKNIFLAVVLGISVVLNAQDKVPLTHEVYDQWKSIENYRLSPNGGWLAYEVNPARGDGCLILKNLETGKTDTLHRGSQGAFVPGSQTLVFRIKPPFELTRQARIDKKKPDEMPRDFLGVFHLAEDRLDTMPNLKNFKIPEERSEWFAYQLGKELPLQDTLKVDDEMNEEEKEELKKQKEEIKKANEKIKKAKGSDLVIVNPSTGKEYLFSDITEYTLSKRGDLFLLTETKNDSVERARVLAFLPGDEKHLTLFEHEGSVKSLTADEAGLQAAFLFSADTGKTKIFDLHHALVKEGRAGMIIDTLTSGMPPGWCVSEHGQISFSEDGSRLFFGTAPVPLPEPKDSLPDDEKIVVDVWNWNDGMLQPMQKARLDQLKKASYTAVYHLKKKRMIRLADEEMRQVRLSAKGNGNMALGIAYVPYLKYQSWMAGGYQDIYQVDVSTGVRELIHKMTRNRMYFSPEGKYMAWFNSNDSIWYAYSTEKKTTVPLTKGLEAAFYYVLHDAPMPVPSNGLAGWTEGDRFLLVYDNNDIWKLDPSGKLPPVNATAGTGKENGLRYRYVKLDRDKEHIPLKETSLLRIFDLKDKSAGYANVVFDRPAPPEELVRGDFSFYGEEKAKSAGRIVWRRSCYQEYPDLWISDMQFRRPVKVSHANPQQDGYLWGTAELVSWTSFGGEELQGILLKPENFDAEKKYPMVVYFYERSTDGLHRHMIPSPSRSIINFPLFTSNGYLVFIPDIPYTIGYPGESGYNAVVSGTKALIERFPFIDRECLGIQGHSWGGYQTAYIITRTNLFRAAEAGAPVSNMTSAYGGIRWESGMVRQFQYEETQSRIGGTLWEKPWHYIGNSPLFHVPKIETPLLILHNDDDGAVPWYQGIELFVALRRLDKPVWMLNYNGQPHGVVKWGNRVDFSVRMMQFFDHYLKGAPPPEWMVKGIPATEKGVNNGYRLMTD